MPATTRLRKRKGSKGGEEWERKKDRESKQASKLATVAEAHAKVKLIAKHSTIN